MAGYRYLISEKKLHKIQYRARCLTANRGVNILSINYKNNELVFKVNSGTDPRVVWTQRVQLIDVTPEKILNVKSFKDVESLILNGNLKVYCNCQAFLYWGPKYWAWRRGYGLEKETRRPVVRNPYGKYLICFPAGQFVLTSDGYKDIKDVQVGDLVFTHKGRLRRVTAKGSREADSLLSLRVGQKNWITCTPNHPFWVQECTWKSNSSSYVFEPSKLKWKNASDIKVNDLLTLPKLQLEHTVKYNSKLAFIIGLYLADGSISCFLPKTDKSTLKVGKYGVFSFCIALCHEYRHYYFNLFDSMGISYKYVQSSSGGGILYTRDKTVLKECLRVGNFTSEEFGESKCLIDEVLSWDEESQRALVSGFYLGDGTLVNGSGTVGNRHPYVTLFNTNRQVLSKIFILVSQWWRAGFNYYDRKPFYSKLFKSLVYPKRMYYIRFTGSVVREFSEMCGHFFECKSGYTSNLSFTKWQQKFKEFDGAEYRCIPVKEKIDGLPGDIVYSLSVDEDETFIVNGVVVHNCKHLYAVLQTFPFLSSTIASKYRNYYQHKLETDPEFASKFPELTKPGNVSQSGLSTSEQQILNQFAEENSIGETSTE